MGERRAYPTRKGADGGQEAAESSDDRQRQRSKAGLQVAYDTVRRGQADSGRGYPAAERKDDFQRQLQGSTERAPIFRRRSHHDPHARMSD